MTRFNDLSEDRQHEIITNRMPDDWHDYLLEEIKGELVEYGFLGADISYSGWYSQGDGASFTADLYFGTFYNKIKNENFDFQFRTESVDAEGDDLILLETVGIPTVNPMEILLQNGFWYGKLKRTNSRYVHENTVELDISIEEFEIVPDGETPDYTQFEVSNEDTKEIGQLTEYLERYANDWIKNKCKEIYDRLHKEWEGWIESELEHHREENNKFSESEYSHY